MIENHGYISNDEDAYLIVSAMFLVVMTAPILIPCMIIWSLVSKLWRRK